MLRGQRGGLGWPGCTSLITGLSVPAWLPAWLLLACLYQPDWAAGCWLLAAQPSDPGRQLFLPPHVHIPAMFWPTPPLPIRTASALFWGLLMPPPCCRACALAHACTWRRTHPCLPLRTPTPHPILNPHGIPFLETRLCKAFCIPFITTPVASRRPVVLAPALTAALLPGPGPCSLSCRPLMASLPQTPFVSPMCKQNKVHE